MALNTHIAGYDIIKQLGKGAGSDLYAVRDKKGQRYCLKHVVKKNPKDQRFLDQALMEHQIACQFEHPSLRQSFKVIKQREIFRVTEVIVIMELVEGATLETLRVPDMRALLKICHAAAEGLQTMHKGSFVHADIKPNNIMVTPEGQVKIIDFGQSCAIGTVKQRIQGTPDYIAPEQVKREAITEQTDVFNLGATMYWLLTEQKVPTIMPERKATSDAIRKKEKELVKSAPPIELNADVPPALSSLVMDCVEKNPRDRPPRMGAVIERLEMAYAQLRRDHAKPSEAATTDTTSAANRALHDTAELGVKELGAKE